MIIALKNPVVPEYRATVKLIPVQEKPAMKIINRYKKPTLAEQRRVAQWFLVLWALSSVLFLILAPGLAFPN